MRNPLLLLGIAAILTITSCFSENAIPEPLLPESVDSEVSYISLSVIEESESAEHAGCWNDEPFYEPVPGAKVELTFLEDEERPFPLDVPTEGYTDQQGRLLLEGLPAGKYRVTVESGLQYDDREITTRLGEVSRVYVRF